MEYGLHLRGLTPATSTSILQLRGIACLNFEHVIDSYWTCAVLGLPMCKFLACQIWIARHELCAFVECGIGGRALCLAEK